MSNNVKRVKNHQIKSATKIIENYLIPEIKSVLDSEYVFDRRLAGSAKHNLVVKDDDGSWDLDYQLYLTENSRKSLNDATYIKQRFGQIINDLVDGEVSNGTTAITFNLGDYDDNFSDVFVDMVIMKENKGYKEIIKRNPDIYHSDTSHWTEWTIKYDNAEEKVKSLNDQEKYDIMEEVRERKEKCRLNDCDKSGTEIFMEVLGDYRE